MTIETSCNKVHYIGNGSTTEFPIPFVINDISNVLLYLRTPDGQQTKKQSGFTIQGSNLRNCNVVLDEPLEAGVQLSIVRIVPLIQQLDLENGGAFDAESIEKQFDLHAMQVQQLDEKVERALKVAISHTGNVENLIEDLFAVKDKAETAAEIASNIAYTLAHVRANASTLEADETATAYYSGEHGILYLGIPKGKQGTAGRDAYPVSAGVLDCGYAQKTLLTILDAGRV